MYLCRLPSSWDNRPHRSETNILRSILPVGTPVKIRCCRGKRTVPVKADFFLETGESVLDIVQELKIQKRVLHPCSDIVPYQPLLHILLHQIDCNYEEDVDVFQPFVKGRLKFGDLNENEIN
ncbi:unnamed protein product [Gongylonema pulchrum]|uniref:SPATA6 domain-containing protein n=1 Tax=Gongylonema pulchrum TaxID=637853 RepID=A0A183DIE4_9BILA|nr:unnamed protein product [Gongylonema pulchrum]